MINIEICKSPNKPGTWNMRIGDIEGSTNVYNMSKDDIIDFILLEMSNEFKKVDNLSLFKLGDKVKVTACPECGILQVLHDDMIGTHFYCRYCKKSVESLKILKGLILCRS